MMLLSVQGMDVAGIAKVTFTSPDCVREVLQATTSSRERGLGGSYGRHLARDIVEWAFIGHGPGRPDVAAADVIGDPLPREALLAKALVELADTLVAEFDVVELLSRLAEHCVEVLDVTAAGLMLAGPDGELRVMASSSEAMRVLELFELQAREGPCLDCYRTGRPVMDSDLATADNRWPRFAAETLAAGFCSVQALPMRLRGNIIGALNLFHVQRGEMSEADVEAAQALADVATIAILQHRASLEAQVLNQQLQHALNSRVIIEQAKGIVAERAGLDMDQAFSALRSYARNRNLGLVAVAEAVIAGSLTPSALGSVPRPRPPAR